MRDPKRLPALLILAALGALAVLALAWPPAAPPRAVPATAPEASFSAERARVHLREITRSPRPIGSEAHAEVRAYLVDELRKLALEPELQRATAVRHTGNTLAAGYVVNVAARLPGTHSTAAVVLLSHYDSVPTAPGAADAGHGVAAILETVRALRAGPPLRNDVIVLITDGEETGLFGAQAYVDEHPWAGDTGIVLNAEGRGNTGPVQMFRTTAGNGRMIETLAAAAPYPAAESLANEIFRLMPNDTDLSVFERAGYAGMDFANVHGLTHYHSPLDSFENADPRTLQHHGSYLLGLTRAFGDMDLRALSAPDRIYFSLPLVGLVHYPMSWAVGLAVLAALLVCGITAVAIRQRAVRGRDLCNGALLLAAALVVLPLLALACWRVLALWVPEVAWFSHGSPYDSGRYMLGISLLVIAIFAAVAERWGGRIAASGTLVAAMIAWTILGLVSAAWLPGASYVFLWPPVFAALGFAAWLGRGHEEGAWVAPVLVIAALPAILMVAPLAEGVAVALTLDMIAAPILLVTLALGLLVLQFDFAARRLRPAFAFPGLLALAGAVLLGVALHDAEINAERKKPNSVQYIADLDLGEARWYSTDPGPDEWTRHYLGDAPVRAELPAWAPARLVGGDGRAWQAAAVIRDSPGPSALLLESVPAGEGRRLRLRIVPAEGSHFEVLGFPGAARLSALRIEGREVPMPPADAGEEFQLVVFAMPPEGMEVEFVAADPDPVQLYLRSNFRGLPPSNAGESPPRPAHLMQGGRLGDLTRVQRTIEFP
jgi:hypothetical protein